MSSQIISIRQEFMDMFDMIGDYSYTSKGIARLKGNKPSISIGISSKTKIELAGEVKGSIKDLSLSGNLLITFIAKCCADIKETLTDEWKSFGLVIGTKGAEITPLNILSVTESSDLNWSSKAIELVHSEEYKYWLYYCVYLLRLHMDNNSNNQHKKLIAKTSMENHLRTLRPPPGATSSLDKVRLSHIYHENFLKLLSAIDMFLFRFPENEFAKIRIGTDIYRMQDCAGLEAMFHAKSHLGFDSIFELCKWAFTLDMQYNVRIITKKGEELELQHSYSKYLKGMALSRKSYYSSTEIGSMYFFCNSLAALYGSDRGAYTKMLLRNRVPESSMGVILAFLAYNDGSDRGDMPNSRESGDWLQWYNKHKGNLPLNCIQKLRRACLNIRHNRPGTIGEFWYRKYGVESD